jgi:hypothetical protein
MDYNIKKVILQKSYNACGSTGGMVIQAGRTHGGPGTTNKTPPLEPVTTLFFDFWNLARIGLARTRKRSMILLR